MHTRDFPVTVQISHPLMADRLASSVEPAGNPAVTSGRLWGPCTNCKERKLRCILPLDGGACAKCQDAPRDSGLPMCSGPTESRRPKGKPKEPKEAPPNAAPGLAAVALKQKPRGGSKGHPHAPNNGPLGPSAHYRLIKPAPCSDKALVW